MKRQICQDIHDLARETGYKAYAIEKMIMLFDILQEIERDEFLRERLAITGGTALNAFHLNLNRLSVDIDLQCIGAVDEGSAQAERADIDGMLERILNDQGHEILKPKIREGGTSWKTNFDSSLGGISGLRVDLGHVARMSLFGETRVPSRMLCGVRAVDILTFSRADVVVGKLAALIQRNRARDLYDAVNIAKFKDDLNMDYIRPAVIASVAASPGGWQDRGLGDPGDHPHDFCQSLMTCLPTNYFLNSPPGNFHNNIDATAAWYDNSIRICQEAFGDLLVLTPQERKFVDGVQKHGKANSSLLGAPSDLCARIADWPLLAWKCQKVRENLGRGW